MHKCCSYSAAVIGNRISPQLKAGYNFGSRLNQNRLQLRIQTNNVKVYALEMIKVLIEPQVSDVIVIWIYRVSLTVSESFLVGGVVRESDSDSPPPHEEGFPDRCPGSSLLCFLAQYHLNRLIDALLEKDRWSGHPHR
ncbi:hypothetical protein TNIN_334311 [Trichonephila inaurata madagascariensis]|uniref:Uncharacterized protein n=1 Tax=Trichonephila inaurata madagascariensis TaxID=2747483 RepID=A0A8X6XPV5_9ARAC|nr:hypothetical protein TNIN_334311 [Trichonephila inaurata madagascariensis]